MNSRLFNRILFILATVSLTSGSVLAEDNCSKVENLFLSRQTETYPTQGGLMWCFAFAAAKIVNFETQKYVNPYAVAFYGHSIDNGLFSPVHAARIGGYIHTALNFSTSQGYCSSPPSSQTQDSMDQLQSHYHHQHRLTGPQLLNAAQAFAHGIQRDCPKNTLVRDIRSPENKRLRLLRIVTHPEHKDFKSFGSDKKTAKASALATMNKVLESGQPLALGYQKRHPKSGHRYNHGAVIVGRERNSQTGACEYLLSDSEVDCRDYPAPACSAQIYRIDRANLYDSAIEVNFFWPQGRRLK